MQLTRLRDPDSCTPLHVALLHGTSFKDLLWRVFAVPACELARHLGSGILDALSPTCMHGAGHLDLVRLLLERNPGSLTSRCEGSPPLHVAACLGALPARRDFALQAAQLLISHGAPVRER